MNARIEELFEALDADGLDAVAQDELAGLLQESGDWGGLTRLYETLAERAESDANRTKLYIKAADAIESSGNDLERAVELLERALGGDSEEVADALPRMRGLLKRLGDWENWLEVAEFELASIDDDADSTALLLLMGDVALEHLEDSERGLDYYQSAFQRDSKCVDALHKARSVYEQMENWGQVFELYELQVEQSNEPEQRAQLLCDMGGLAFSLGELDAARTCFTEALNAVEGYADALEGLAKLDDGVDALSEPSAGADEATDGDTMQQQVIGEDSVAQPTEANDTAILPSSLDDSKETELLPTAEGEAEVDEQQHDKSETTVQPTVAETEMLAAVNDADDNEQAEEEVVPEEIEARIEALLDEAALAEGERQVECLSEAALLARNEQAATIYQTLLEHAADAFQAYLTVGSALKLDSESCERIEAYLNTLSEAESYGADCLKAHALLMAGRHRNLGTVDQKIRELNRKSDEQELIDWVVQRHVEAGKWRNAQQAMAESIGGDPAMARLDALRRVAELAENRAGDDQQAMGFWRQVIQTEPDDEEAIEALLRLYPKVNKWREYGALLKGVLDQTSPSDVSRRQELIELLIPVA